MSHIPSGTSESPCGWNPERLPSRQEAADYFSISVRSLDSIPEDQLPRVRIGRSVRFDPDDLRTFIASRKSGSVR